MKNSASIAHWRRIQGLQGLREAAAQSPGVTCIPYRSDARTTSNLASFFVHDITLMNKNYRNTQYPLPNSRMLSNNCNM